MTIVIEAIPEYDEEEVREMDEETRREVLRALIECRIAASRLTDIPGVSDIVERLSSIIDEVAGAREDAPKE